MNKLTVEKFEAIMPHEKTRAYFTNPLNLEPNGGQSLYVQARWFNNFQKAFDEFKRKLPSESKFTGKISN